MAKNYRYHASGCPDFSLAPEVTAKTESHRAKNDEKRIFLEFVE